MSLPSRVDSRSLDLSDPALRRSLEDMVRRRAPAGEVDDIVQNTLIEALASPSAPEESEALRRWVFGIARHKIADYHRKARREGGELPELEAESAPHGARDLLSWAERELPPGQGGKETLDWLLREGDGEKLESIAASEKLPAPRVRQRVTRLRQHYRARWAAQAAAVAALLAAAIVAWVWLKNPTTPEHPIVRDAPRPEVQRGIELRKLALERCTAKDWDACVKGLDEAKKLDPAGDDAAPVQEARKAAGEASKPAPSVPTAVPNDVAPQNVAPQNVAPQNQVPNPKVAPNPTDAPPLDAKAPLPMPTMQSSAPVPQTSAAPAPVTQPLPKKSEAKPAAKSKDGFSESINFDSGGSSEGKKASKSGK